LPYLHHFVNGTSLAYYQLPSADADSPTAFTLGRSPDNSLVMDDPTVSAQHALIQAEGGAWMLRDRDSTNGVRVNGRRQREASLQPGDRVQIGTHELVLVTELPEALHQTQKIKKSWIPGVYYTSDH